MNRYGNRSDDCRLLSSTFADLHREIQTIFETVPLYVQLLADQLGHNLSPIEVMATKPPITLDSATIQAATLLIQAGGNWTKDAISVVVARFPTKHLAAPQKMLRHFSSRSLQRRPSGEPISITLRVGQRIICTKNNRSAGIYNGLVGVVERLHPRSILIRTDMDETVMVSMTTSNIAMSLTTKRHVCVPLVSTTEHMPVKGANAITIHKAQGLTLSRVVLFLGDCGAKNPGLAYVGLSRCTSEEGLYLGEDIHPSAAFPNFASLQFRDQVYEHRAGNQASLHRRVHQYCGKCGKFYVPLFQGKLCFPCT
jgi:hypothetical protein